MVVRYDPRDLSAVWVELDGGRCIEARYRNLEIPPVSLWEYREVMQKARAVGKVGTNDFVLAELIRQQHETEGECHALTKAERRFRERHSWMKGLAGDDRASEGLQPVDTGDTSRPIYKVERR